MGGAGSFSQLKSSAVLEFTGMAGCFARMLTTGVNFFTGGKGDDTFNALDTATFNSLDSLDGGDGAGDTLNVADNANAAVVATAGRIVKNIEIANLSSADSLTADTTSWTGLQTLTATANGTGNVIVTAATTTTTSVSASLSAGDFTITGGKNVTVSGTLANDMLLTGVSGSITVTAGADAGDILSINSSGSLLTSVNVLDGGIVAIGDGLTALADVTVGDDAVTDTLTTVSIAGNLGVSTINSDVLTSLTLADSGQNSTVTAAAGTRVLGLTVNKLTGGTIDDATATTVNVVSTGTASTGITIDVAAATTVAINAAAALTATYNLDVATSVAISGSSLVTFTGFGDTDSLATLTVSGSAGINGDVSAQTVLTSVNAAGTSGANTVTLDATTSSYAGGSGVDTVTLLATPTKSINGGSGDNDVFVWNVNGSYTTDTDISGFEVIGAGLAVTADSISTTGFTRIQHGQITGDVTYTNVAANSTLTLTADPTANSTITLASSAGTSDQFNLVLTKSGLLPTFRTPIIENLNISKHTFGQAT
jgi:hypothetical protein